MRVAATRLAAAPAPAPAPRPLLVLLLVLLVSAPLATGAAAMAGHVLGGVKENPAAANSAESDGLGRFAVEEHNKRQASGYPRGPFPFSPAPLPGSRITIPFSGARRFGRFVRLGVRF